MMRYTCLLITALCFAQIVCAQKTDTIIMPSGILKEDIEIWVTKPDGYDTGTTKLPVLIALDADALQEYLPMYIKYLSRPFEPTVPAMLVVGIRSKSPRWRAKNFIPKTGIDSLDSKPDRGHADALLGMIRDELLITVNSHYRAADIRILAGHSLAGLFGIYAMHADPKLFRAVLAVSPSPLNGLIADTFIPSILAAKKETPAFLYFSVAGNDNRGYHEGSMAIRRALEKTPSRQLAWKQEVFDDKTHWTTAPPAFYNGLIWLFRQESMNTLPGK